jgi:drug/metabolite transporter (DMT)-like permease
VTVKLTHPAILLTAVTLIWGVNWPVMKLIINEVHVVVFRTYCVTAGALGLFAIAAMNGGMGSLKVPKGQWGRITLLALFNVTNWHLLGTIALLNLPPGRAAILAYTMPAWTVLLSAWLLKEPLTKSRIAALVLGWIGLALLIAEDWRQVVGAPIGAICMLLAALGWAFGTVLYKKLPITLDTAASTAWQLVIGGIPVLLLGAFLPSAQFAMPSNTALAGILFNVTLVFILANWCWFRLVRTTSASVLGLSTMAIPVVGVLSTVWLMGIRPTTLDTIALGFILASLIVTYLPNLVSTFNSTSGKNNE